MLSMHCILQLHVCITVYHNPAAHEAFDTKPLQFLVFSSYFMPSFLTSHYCCPFVMLRSVIHDTVCRNY